MTYRPLSFEEMVKDATGSVMAAMKDGLKRIEVEFPPVPTKMEGRCCGSRSDMAAIQEGVQCTQKTGAITRTGKIPRSSVFAACMSLHVH